MLRFTASNPSKSSGFILISEIRDSEKLYNKNGYSVFTWQENKKLGVCNWKEKHDVAWEEAFAIAHNWIK